MSQDFGNKNQLFKTPPKNITNPFPNIQSNALRPESTLPHHFAKVFYVLYATTPTLKAQYTVRVSLINPPKRPSPKTTPNKIRRFTSIQFAVSKRYRHGSIRFGNPAALFFRIIIHV